MTDGGGGISGTLDSPESGLPRMSRTAAGLRISSSAADTSSAAAGSTPVVGAAAASAALIAEPIPAKSVAAATIKYGAMIANDMPHLKPASLDFRQTRVTPA